MAGKLYEPTVTKPKLSFFEVPERCYVGASTQEPTKKTRRYRLALPQAKMKPEKEPFKETVVYKVPLPGFMFCQSVLGRS